MKYIETPVDHNGVGNIGMGDHVLASVNGPQPFRSEAAEEITKAINAYDTLVALKNQVWQFLVRWNTETEGAPQDVIDWTDDALAPDFIALRYALYEAETCAPSTS